MSGPRENWDGGLTLVGERGPELINIATGTQIIPNHSIAPRPEPDPEPDEDETEPDE